MKPRVGDVIENPVGRERIIFLATGEQTGGRLLRIGWTIGVDGGVDEKQLHPEQETRIQLLAGEMALVVEGRERVLRAGEEAIVPTGAAYEWRNTGEDEIEALFELRPAGRFHEYVTSYFGLARTGHVTPTGKVSILQGAVMLHEYRDTIRMARMGLLMRRLVVPFLAAIGRLLGLRANYPYPRPRAHRPAATGYRHPVDEIGFAEGEESRSIYDALLVS